MNSGSPKSVTSFRHFGDIGRPGFLPGEGIVGCPGRTEGQQDNFVSNVAGNLKDSDARVMKETFCKPRLPLLRLLHWKSDSNLNVQD